MRKAKVTYIAPEGESKVVETRGQTFFDGHAVDLNTDDHGALIAKCQGNPHFDVELGEEQPSAPTAKRGRPSNADKAAKEASMQVLTEQKPTDAQNQG